MSNIHCPNCGAIFSEQDTRCPYCGYLNPSGAERSYMDKLEKNRKRLDNVDEEAAGQYADEMKRHGKRAFLTVVIIAAVAAVLILGGILLGRILSRTGDDSPEAKTEEMLWQRENFPRLDALYEEGDYEGLANLYREFLMEDADHELWQWEHYDLASYYDMYLQMKDDVQYMEENGAEPLDAADAFYVAAKFYYREYAVTRSIPAEDKEALEALREEVVPVLYDRLHLSDDDMENYRKSVFQDDSYVSWRACEKLGNELAKRFE